MREIKFRAWGFNNEFPNGKMTYLDTKPNNFLLNFNGDLIITSRQKNNTTGYDLVFARIGWNDLKLMQYIGLKDKNGVEIYEGDVVTHNRVEKGVVKWINERAAFYVVTSTNTSRDIINRDPWEYAFMINAFKFEVIGNIYENPELL